MISQFGPHTTKITDRDIRSDIFTNDSSIYEDFYQYDNRKQFKYSPKDNMMGDLNLDRFGNPIESKKLTHVVPGPGSYDPDVYQNVKLGVFQGNEINFVIMF